MDKISKSRIILTIFSVFLCNFNFLSFLSSKNFLFSGPLLEIPSLNLSSAVIPLSLEDNQLETPSQIVGAFSSSKNKTLLIGHSTSIFQNLQNLALGSKITYNQKTYLVTSSTTLAKASISMSDLLAPSEKDTLVLMTCAGTLERNGDASHRLIITAERSDL